MLRQAFTTKNPIPPPPLHLVQNPQVALWVGRQYYPISWYLMSSDVSWHIWDKLWPVPKHGSVILYVHGNQKARLNGRPPRLSRSSWTMQYYPVRRPSLYWTPPPPTLGCTAFPRLIKLTHIFCHPGVFFLKVAEILIFWKAAINFCDSVNPLWVSSRFSLTQLIQ